MKHILLFITGLLVLLSATVFLALIFGLVVVISAKFGTLAGVVFLLLIAGAYPLGAYLLDEL